MFAVMATELLLDDGMVCCMPALVCDTESWLEQVCINLQHSAQTSQRRTHRGDTTGTDEGDG